MICWPNVFPFINVTLGPAILVLSLHDFNFQYPSLEERVACSLLRYSTCRELKFALVKAVISASIRLRFIAAWSSLFIIPPLAILTV